MVRWIATRLLVSLLVVLPAAVAADTTALLQPGETLLQVSGEGAVFSTPDKVTFTTSASAEADSPIEAVSEVGRRLEAMIAASRGLGIADLQITTNRVVVNPIESARDDDNDGVDRRIDPLRYRSRNTLTFTISNGNDASRLMAALIEAGATGLSGPEFGLRDPRAAEHEAERLALLDARERAERQAAQIGMRVVRPVLVSDRRNFSQDGADIIVTGSMIRAGVQIQPTDVETRNTLFVEFALAPL